MKVTLLRNYPHDGSVSMRVFADLLSRELKAKGHDVKEVTPKPIFGRIHPGANGLGKWLGYIDRYVLFPSALRRAAAKSDVIHICDHGNAMYASAVRNRPVLVTCHDLLAVRGALGEVDDCKASFFGRFLQRWIVSGLRNATGVACVSQFTLEDARRILGSKAKLHVVINGLPNRYAVINPAEIDRRLSAIHGLDARFILHVGSNLTRKNRAGVIRVFAKACERLELHLVIAGQALNEDLLRIAEQFGVRDRVIQVVHPSSEVLEALYNRALALVFPSRYEGFGWPPVEAQACGCPVIASDIAPFREVLGESAPLFAVDDEIGMAGAVVRLATDNQYRNDMRERGFKNVRARFETSRMIDDYLTLYREITCPN